MVANDISRKTAQLATGTVKLFIDTLRPVPGASKLSRKPKLLPGMVMHHSTRYSVRHSLYLVGFEVALSQLSYLLHSAGPVLYEQANDLVVTLL
jgi:hypothetical protein